MCTAITVVLRSILVVMALLVVAVPANADGPVATNADRVAIGGYGE